MIRPPRYGLTLLELVVVLAILAVLALVAVVATESAVDQARYDVTVRTLENIDTAVLGPVAGTTANDSRGFAGFIVDVGRPPLTVGADPNSGMQLAELWSNPRGLRPYGPATGPSGITVYSGWRGPYLKLSSNVGINLRLLDGWGNSLRALAGDDVTVLGADMPVARVRSDGAAAVPYDTQLFTTRTFSNWTGVVTGSLVDSAPISPVTLSTEVRLIVPDGSILSGVREYVRTFDTSGTDTTAVAVVRTGFQFQFPDPANYVSETDLAMGPKVLKITQPGRPPVIVHFWLPAGAMATTERMDLQ